MSREDELSPTELDRFSLIYALFGGSWRGTKSVIEEAIPRLKGKDLLLNALISGMSLR